ncbi:uncharacterized protein TRAVEDRAFT_52808 [Trametes versicolor FP-101664 SS1]|uniref:uncharacterized protein n=1 Tax=Trametes versicolor (strain FP-101664) TaxID=717944 RepID=UPI000462326D|nr:uncharacterized protein TRAVEDRAFT_52808 [Trametes versicolor FP-101664 SS1]EIW53689.1 hypothetical protein TRAVEDRAFT_52808 [Trametes versicolor FP-101664 SS1]
MPRDDVTRGCLQAVMDSLNLLPDVLFEASTTTKEVEVAVGQTGHIVHLQKASFTAARAELPFDPSTNIIYRIKIIYNSNTPKLNLTLYVYQPQNGLVRVRTAVRLGLQTFQDKDSTYYTDQKTA